MDNNTTQLNGFLKNWYTSRIADVTDDSVNESMHSLFIVQDGLINKLNANSEDLE